MKDYTESSGSYKFLHKDYLGSILAITDEAGNIKEQRHFDAWGNLTHFKANGVDKNVNEFNDLSLISRGYTGHEHFLEVGIIHMNGRLYDPLLRRFLNADENIQDPHNPQNYNKYGYVINNPLLYADVSGEDFGISLIIAAAVAAFTSVATDYYLNRPVDIGNVFQSVVMAVVSAGVSNGIGNIFKAGSEVAKALGKAGTIIARAGAHAIAQGALSYVQGGNFLSGALAGAFASVSNDLLGHYIDKAGSNSFIRTKGFALITGAVSGGVGSALGGGNFWMGAGQGLIVTAFNFLAHKETTNLGDDDPKKKATTKTTGKKVTSKQTIIQSLHKGFDYVEEFGGWVEVAGIVLAPETEGVSLSVAEFGSKVTLIGHVGNSLLDLYEGNGKAFLYRQVKYGITVGLGKVIDRVAPGVVDNLILKANLYIQDKFVEPKFRTVIIPPYKK